MAEDIDEFLARDVYPALFSRLDTAFPEFGWESRDSGWLATEWPSSFPCKVSDPRPGRLMVYADRPYWIKVHGHEGVRLLDYVNSGRRPHGTEFLPAVRRLCELACVPFPERQRSDEEVEAARRREERRGFLEVMASVCEEVLWGTNAGQAAVRYLVEERHLTAEEVRAFRLGLLAGDEADVLARLKGRGWARDAAREHLRGWQKLWGYVAIPWHDEHGRPLTFYGRWPAKTPPLKRNLPAWRKERDEEFARWKAAKEKTGDGKEWKEPAVPKTFALPGANSKSSPFCLDRSLRAGHRELVCVEGVLDAVMLQARGETRAVASGSAQFDGNQLATLTRCRVERVFICGDPAGGGDAGTARNVVSLARHAITPFVVPRLPDGMDPDDYVHQHGIGPWRDLVRRSGHGFRHLARVLLDGHTANYGERQPGDDVWTEDLIARAVAGAKELPAEQRDTVARYYLAPVAEASGVLLVDLERRVGGPPEAEAAGGDDASGPESEGEPSSPDEAEEDAGRFGLIDSRTFFATDYRQEWLVKNVLAKRAAGTLGGPKKCLKTTTLVDLVVSLGTATLFLGHFQTYARTRVVLVSAESGEATIQATAQRVCRARGIAPGELQGWCWWAFRLPQFGNAVDVARFAGVLSRLGEEGVAILDPLYLALMAGIDTRAVEAGNLYHVGPLLKRVSESCLSVGWTPILCHHARKHTDRDLEPMDLDDLSFAGIAEFARQWILESRREAYKDGTGSHRLWLRTGSSVGFGGLWAVDVEEGQIAQHDDDSPIIPLDSRRWDVSVRPARDHVKEEKSSKEAFRDAEKQRQLKEDGARVLNTLDRRVEQGEGVEGWVVYSKVRDAAGVNNPRMVQILDPTFRYRPERV